MYLSKSRILITRGLRFPIGSSFVMRGASNSQPSSQRGGLAPNIFANPTYGEEERGIASDPKFRDPFRNKVIIKRSGKGNECGEREEVKSGSAYLVGIVVN